MKTIARCCLLLFVFCCAHYSVVFPQSVDNIVGDVVMPPPEVASLGKYTDIDVSLSTGVPSIGIPIYNLQEGSLNLPISLSYHAAGIKVAEMASWVGTGWTLQAGGMISRTVMGIPDEWEYGFWNTGENLYNNFYGAPMNNWWPVPPHEASNAIANNIQDGEPDIFVFNISGYSGHFYFDVENGIRQITVVPQQDVKILEHVDDNLDYEDRITGFTLITPDGTRYLFGKQNGENAIDKTIFPDSYGSAVYGSKAWRLVKIESHDAKFSINLSYQEDHFSYIYPSTQYTTYYQSLTSEVFPSSNSGGSSPIPQYNYGLQLSTISTPTEMVTFLGAADRQDTEMISGSNGTLGKKLDRIEIATGNKCKAFDFEYDYFTENANPTSYTQKKLQLLNVQEKSCDNAIILPPYVFSYNGDFLPSITNHAIDHWGYYNGAESNNSISPPGNRSIPPTILTTNGITRIRGGAERETNEDFLLKGILEKIEYPTGGYAKYSYEANSYWENTPQRITDQIIDFHRDGCVTPYPCYGGFISDDFTYDINENWEYGLEIIMCDPSYPDPLAPAPVVFQLLDVNGNVIANKSFDFGVPNYYVSGYLTDLFPNLTGGNSYKIKLLSLCEVNSPYRPEITFDVGYSYTQPVGNVKVGGARIKSILLHDGIAQNNDILRTYEYEFNGSSSGHLLSKPVYGHAFSFNMGDRHLSSSFSCRVLPFKY